MSLIGKRIIARFPKNNDEMQEISGTVVDKFRNSYVEIRKVGGNEFPISMAFDNYMVKTMSGESHSIHPSLITKIID
jgi:hypothetical protein